MPSEMAVTINQSAMSNLLKPIVMSAALLALTACEVLPERPAIHYTGDPVVDGNAELAVAPAKDRVVWDYRIAASALRAGNFIEAEAKLDDAIGRIGGILAGSN